MDLEKELFRRFDDQYPKTISCDIGWYGLIKELHEKLIRIDPNYTIFQIKEKFGGLRYYCTSNSEDLRIKIATVVEIYERKSFGICELTGMPGILMKKGVNYKTLHDSFISDGWKPVKNF